MRISIYAVINFLKEGTVQYPNMLQLPESTVRKSALMAILHFYFIFFMYWCSISPICHPGVLIEDGDVFLKRTLYPYILFYLSKI